MARMSNRERIARAAEEARLGAAEKAAKKAQKKPRAPKAPVRMKVVWDVCNTTGDAVKTFAYPDKAQAEAETESLTRSTGRTHILRPTHVPME